MSVKLTYTDSIRLVKPVIDNYGGERIGQIETVSCIFITRTGESHSNNQNVITTDASLYIDPAHWFVVNNFNRIEEFLIIANRFNSTDGDSWYKITNVSIGMDKLLENKIDHIKVSLKKTVGLNYVS